MGRPHLAHHVELQFYICRQPLKHHRRIVLIHKQVRKKTGQSLPVVVSGIAEIAQHHHHREDDLTLGGLLLWSHAAIYHGSLRADGQQTVLDAQVIASPMVVTRFATSRCLDGSGTRGIEDGAFSRGMQNPRVPMHTPWASDDSYRPITDLYTAVR